jgi:hypothetical protein
MAKNNTTRLPRVRRFEYLLAYIESLSLGLDVKEIALKLAEKKKDFEIKKLQALARGKTFSKKLEATDSLQIDCRKLATILNYAVLKNNEAKITQEGIDFLTKNSETKKQEFCKRYIETYVLAEKFLCLLVANPKIEYVLPMKRNNEEFREVAKKQSINLDQTNFEILRDMFHFFGLINWFPFIADNARLLNMYPTMCACSVDRKDCSDSPAIDFQGKTYCSNSVNRTEFRNIIWEEYLGLANYVPRRAILYSDLRDRVCYRLHIPDEVFDRHVKAMLNEDPELIIVGSKGSIPFSPSLFAFLKRLPPEIDDKIMVYIKMDRKKNDEGLLKI